MDTPASKEAADKSISTKSAVETEAKDFVEVERNKPALAMPRQNGDGCRKNTILYRAVDFKFDQRT